MRIGIALKLNLIVLVAVLALGGTLGAFFVTEQRKSLDGELERRIETAGRYLALDVGDALAANDADTLNRTLQTATLDREIAYLIVKSVDGDIRAARWAAQTRGDVTEYSFPLRRAARRNGGDPAANLFGAATRPAAGEAIGHLAIGIDLSLQHAALQSLVRRTVLAVALGAVLAMLLGIVFVSLLLRRSITPLLAGIRGIGAGDLSQRVRLGRNDEIGEIGGAFNDMADRLFATLVSKQELEATVLTRTAELREALDQRIQLERQLAQSQKIEGIGILAGGIAHDFNNLLTPILGYTEMALLNLPEGHPAGKNLKVVLQSARRASDITRQILAFSRKQILDMKVLDLNDTIGAVVKMLRRLIGEDIEVRLELAAGLPCIKADPAQIQQVLVNLAVNARDAMPGGGAMTIQTSKTTLDGSAAWIRKDLPTGQYAVLSVSDNGVGMDAETRQLIFEPFFTTKEVGKGTGLGLSTVHGIVRQHGGDISVYSEPGRGTTFRIYLPGVREAPAEENAAARPLAKGTGRILLVEDDEAVRELAKVMLTDNGYTVTSVAGGAEALEEARRSAFDLLVSDVIMPGMNGLELHRKIAEFAPGLKALYISGYPAGSGSLRNLFKEGEHLLQKPFTIAELLDKVHAAMDAAV